MVQYPPALASSTGIVHRWSAGLSWVIQTWSSINYDQSSAGKLVDHLGLV